MTRDELLEAIENNEIDFNDLFRKENIENNNINICPVAIINFGSDRPSSSAGIYLITRESKDELEKELKSITDKYMKDINKDTSILLFSQRHIIELSNILFGVFSPLLLVDINNRKWIETLIGTIMTELFCPIYYCKIMEVKEKAIKIIKGKNIDSKYDKLFDKFIENFSIIMDYLWFVPYPCLDNFVKKVVEEYKHNPDIVKGKSNEEANG